MSKLEQEGGTQYLYEKLLWPPLHQSLLAKVVQSRSVQQSKEKADWCTLAATGKGPPALSSAKWQVTKFCQKEGVRCQPSRRVM